MAWVGIRKRQFRPVPNLPTGPSRVKVGFPAGEASAGNISKAVWNEFGTRGGASGGGWGGPIPERPFMRNAMRDNKAAYVSALKMMARQIVEGSLSMFAAMSRLGLKAQGDIQKEISSLMSPPNSPVTIALKGSSKPLIDTGEMRQSVTYKVED